MKKNIPLDLQYTITKKRVVRFLQKMQQQRPHDPHQQLHLVYC